jgi:hypothetical protein
MAHRHDTAFCHHCNERVLTLQEKPAHLFHFVMTGLGVFLWPLALWLFVWIAAGLMPRTLRCSRCGGNVNRAARAAMRARWRAKFVEGRATRAAAKATAAGPASVASHNPATWSPKQTAQHSALPRPPRSARVGPPTH